MKLGKLEAHVRHGGLESTYTTNVTGKKYRYTKTIVSPTLSNNKKESGRI
jgi:hypothetical protein